MATEDYLALARREFRRLKALADRAIAQTAPAQFFVCPSPSDNCLAVIVKHLAGNSLSRWSDFLTADGEKPSRDRDAEFVVAPGDTRELLLERWERGWGACLGALEPLSDADLGRKVLIRGEELTVLQAVSRQLTHYAYHVGQIVYLAKHLAGERWISLSIPRGQSREFNRAPAKYLPPGP